MIGGRMFTTEFTRMVKFLLPTLLFITIGFSIKSYAEAAPVYDADALEQPYETNNAGNESNASVSSEDTVPQTDLPPPPNQTQENAFIPIQSDMQPSAPPSGRIGLERRLQRVEQQISNMQSSDSSAQIESLQHQIQSLRAELEQVTKNLKEAQKQQKVMYADIDARLARPANINVDGNVVKSGRDKPSKVAMSESDQNLTSKQPKPAPEVHTKNKDNPTLASTANTIAKAATDNEAGQPDVEEEQKIYQNAYNMIKSKKYSDAVGILQSMLKKYPSGQFASNAHYWLGELYGLLGKNDKALVEFNQVVTNFSNSPRVSDAMLKVGLIFAAQSKWTDAKSIFKKVVNKYPGTASSRLANEQLKQIREAGH